MITTTIKRWQSQLHARLQQRPPREQRALLALAWFLLLTLTAQGLWMLETSRRGLRQQLPKLAAQAEQMNALYQIWQQHATDAADAATPGNPAAKLEIERRLADLGPGIQAEWSAGGELTLKGKTDSAAWLVWTATLQEEHRMVLTRCRIVPVKNGIEIDASYRRPAT